MNVRFSGTRASLRGARTVAAALPLLAIVAVSCDEPPAAPSASATRSLTVVLLPLDLGYQATAVAAFSDGASRDVTGEAQWASSNPNVAVVSETGRVTPMAPGTTEIRATYETVSGFAPLTVASPPPPPPPPAPLSRKIFGTVRDALDREGVEGVLVTVTAPAQTSGVSGRTDRSGGYSISGPFEGRVTVTATQGGYDRQTVEQSVTDDARVDLSLRPLPFTLSGTIADAWDSPEDLSCEPARVEVLDGANAGRSTVVWRNSNSYVARRYELPNLQPGLATIRASAPEYHPDQITKRLRGTPPYNQLDFKLGGGDRPPCGLIVIGEPARQVFFWPGTKHFRWTFRATAGPVTVRITGVQFQSGASGTLTVQLLRPDLTRLTSTSASNAPFHLAASLPTSGTYTILLEVAGTLGFGPLIAVTQP
jgi:hypothetical protein